MGGFDERRFFEGLSKKATFALDEFGFLAVGPIAERHSTWEIKFSRQTAGIPRLVKASMTRVSEAGKDRQPSDKLYLAIHAGAYGRATGLEERIYEVVYEVTGGTSLARVERGKKVPAKEEEIEAVFLEQIMSAGHRAVDWNERDLKARGRPTPESLYSA